MLENQTLFIGRTVNHVFYFGGRVAPVYTDVNSKNRVGAYLTTRNGPQQTAATLYWAKAQVQYLIGLWFNSPHGHFILGDLN